MEQVKWQLAGDWFDVCKCNIPCPCEFAQAPTFGDCEGILAYHIRQGRYGKVSLDGLNVVSLGTFGGNLWAANTQSRVTVAQFVDERADTRQREALEMIFSGRAGGHPANFAKLLGEFRGSEFAPIKFDIDKKLRHWRVEIPGKVLGEAEALGGPMTPEGELVQTLNPPGSEVGPGTVATWGRATAAKAEAFGFKFDHAGQSSKYIPFKWKGP
jgi:hypothetical protein